MKMAEIYVPAGGPPQGSSPSQEIYGLMGQDNIFAMIRDFYQRLGQSSIKGMFPGDLTLSADKSAAFFVNWLGGPPLYQELYGAPMMRRLHMSFTIDEAARQVWLGCFFATLENADKYHFPEQHLEGFKVFLNVFSAWMVNRQS